MGCDSKKVVPRAIRSSCMSGRVFLLPTGVMRAGTHRTGKENMAEEAKYVEDLIDQEDNFSRWYNQVVREGRPYKQRMEQVQTLAEV